MVPPGRRLQPGGTAVESLVPARLIFPPNTFFFLFASNFTLKDHLHCREMIQLKSGSTSGRIAAFVNFFFLSKVQETLFGRKKNATRQAAKLQVRNKYFTKIKSIKRKHYTMITE